MAFRIFKRFRDLQDVDFGTPADGDVPTYDAGSDTLVMSAGGGSGADDQIAAEVPFTPAGNIAATDVQSAIQELDSEKAATSHVHSGADITTGTVADARIASTIARDSEVSSAISTSEAGQVRDGDAAGGVLAGTYPSPSFASDMATQTELDAHVNDTSAAHAASSIGYTPTGSIAATNVQDAIDEAVSEVVAGAPTGADYLVGTAQGGLSAEIVVGTSPGGELGGTWASPTVDATHSGSSHASVQSAAETTAAAALSAHAAASDPHPTYTTAAELAAYAQPLDSDLTAVAGLSPSNDDVLQRKAGAWTNRTIAQLLSDLGLSALYQPLDSDLTAFAALAIAADKLPYGSGSHALSLADFTAAGRALIDDADASAQLTTLGVSTFIKTLLDDADAATARTTLGISAGSTDGWTAAGETWTYASADAPTFTFTIAGVDLTSKYQPGMRIKLTQTTAKYFIITKVAFSTDTTITVYGGTDYTLANAAITSPYWSMLKAPFGFPLNPTKWTVKLTDTSVRTQSSPTPGTYYNVGSISISIPLGLWNVDYQYVVETDRATNSSHDTYTTLSTSASRGIEELTAYVMAINAINHAASVERRAVLDLAAKTTYYPCLAVSASGLTSLSFVGDANGAATVVRAVCAYL